MIFLIAAGSRHSISFEYRFEEGPHALSPRALGALMRRNGKTLLPACMELGKERLETSEKPSRITTAGSPCGYYPLLPPRTSSPSHGALL